MKLSSFFNKGIYFSNLKRFWVGSLLYAIALILASTIGTFTNFFSEVMTMVVLMSSSLVAIVVAVLVYGFIHSKKYSVMLHSMPVTRLCVYITSILSSLTLMCAPLLVAFVATVIGTGNIGEALLVFFYGVVSIFVSFSVATLIANLVGTSWAVFVVYYGMNMLPYLVMSFVESLMSKYAFGYGYTTSLYFPFVSLQSLLLFGAVGTFDGDGIKFNMTYILISVVVSVVLYVFSYLLYKWRNMENAGNPAAFKAMNHIVKYAVVFIVSQWIGNMYGFGIVVGVIMSAVAYFGTEMILKKKINVWRSYKGYIGFVLVMVAIHLFMANTSIFGYETRVPEVDKVESIELSGNDLSGAFSDKESMKEVIDFHKEIIETRKEVYGSEGISLNITYCKEGGDIERRYFVSKKSVDALYEKLYEREEFKSEFERVFEINEKNISDSLIYYSGERIHLTNEEALEITECLKKDILRKGYKELYPNMSVCEIRIGYLPEGEEYEDYYYVDINYNHTYTVEYLMNNGYAEAVSAIFE